MVTASEVARVTRHVPACHGTAKFAPAREETAIADLRLEAPSGWGPLAKITESRMGFAGLVLAAIAGSLRFLFQPTLCCRVLYLCLKFWQCTDFVLSSARFHRGRGASALTGRMCLWCLLASRAVGSLRVLGQEGFLVLLTQQGTNASRALKPCQGITFLTVLARTRKGEGGKGDEDRHMTPFPLARGAQERGEQVVLAQAESCSLFCPPFPLQHQR